MGLYSNYNGDSRTIPKPPKGLRVDKPDFSRIYFHQGTDSTSGFSWYSQKINFLMEMMKFLPKFEQDGYAGVPSDVFAADLNEYGNAAGSPFWEGDDPLPRLWTEQDGANGIPKPEPNAAGAYTGDYYLLTSSGGLNHVRYNDPWDGKPGRGYTRNQFGAHHRTPRPGQAEGLPWGFFEGQKATNLDYNPAISEFNHFEYDQNNGKYYAKDKSTYDLAASATSNNPISYSSIFGFNPEGYGDIWNGGLSFVNDEDEDNVQTINLMSEGAASTLGAYGDRSYYDIVMSGFGNGASLAFTADPGGGEKYSWASQSGFVYDGMSGPNGEGAFKLMLGMLESRRRIFSAMTELFGDPALIRREVAETHQANPDDAGLINVFNSWFNARQTDKSQSVDFHNLSVFSLFLYAQHSLASAMPAYSNLALGFVFSGEDKAAYERFNGWMNANLATYKQYLNGIDENYRGIGSYRSKVSNLIDEFVGTKEGTTQPFYKSPGWDKYSKNIDNGPQNPPNINPLATSGNVHPDYLVSQVGGINLLGNRAGNVYDRDGVLVSQNLAFRNWAVNDVIKLIQLGDRDVGRSIAINTQNRRNSLKYKQAVKEYQEAKDQARLDEQRAEGKAQAISAQHRADMNKMAQQARKKSDDIKRLMAAAAQSKINNKSHEKRAKEQSAQSKKKK